MPRDIVEALVPPDRRRRGAMAGDGQRGSPPSSREPIQRYLAALFGHAPAITSIEVRWRHGRSMRRVFVPVHDLDVAANAIATRAASTDVYVGVLPRARPGGRRADLVAAGAVLWADCDSPPSVEALSSFPAPPSLWVASSMARSHAYWLLTRAVPLRDIERRNHALAVALSADVACAGAERILRPPMSLNHKHDPPTPVQLVRCDEAIRYAPDDVIRTPSPPHAESPRRSARRRPHDDDDPLLALSPAIYVELLTGRRVPPHRKVACPFHEDRTPSLHVYEEPERGWYCFGCGRGGSVYDLGAAVFGLQPRGESFRTLQHLLDELLSVVA